MSWWQITLSAANNNLADIEKLLFELGSVSVTLQDAKSATRETPLFEPAPGETPLWNHTQLTGLFPDTLNPTAVCAEISTKLDYDIAHISFKKLEDQNWTRAWLKYFRPLCFAQRLWVIPDGYSTPDPSAVNLYLDPGMAFGTGTHATTALCLEWLASHNINNYTVVDYGCGSGILGIAAAALGANHVYCTDIDAQALEASKENAKKNGVNDHLSINFPENLSLNGMADLLIANILAMPLLTLEPVFAKILKSDSILLLSGIMGDQVGMVKQVYTPNFYGISTSLNSDWAMLAYRRR